MLQMATTACSSNQVAAKGTLGEGDVRSLFPGKSRDLPLGLLVSGLAILLVRREGLFQALDSGAGSACEIRPYCGSLEHRD